MAKSSGPGGGGWDYPDIMELLSTAAFIFRLVTEAVRLYHKYQSSRAASTLTNTATDEPPAKA